MSITTTTHLNFSGEARAALEYYQSVFGGHVMIATYGDFGMPQDQPGADHVVFGQVDTDEGFRVMAYDIPGGSVNHSGSTKRKDGVTLTDRPFFVSVRGETFEEVERYWLALSDDASVFEPFGASAWSPGFGMLADKFGVTWILDVAGAQSA